MTLREKILLGFMGVAVAGGGIPYALDLILADGISRNETDMLRQARTVAGEVSTALQSLSISEGQRYILAAALRPASRNPFHIPDASLTSTRAALPSDPSGMAYSGFILVGKSALAIIGGLEYGVGDTLPNSGDVIRAIRADGVTLYSPSRNTEWTLPYTGDDL